MGTVATIERGYRADAGLVPEPTRLNLWVATRGLLHGSFARPRPLRARRGQPGAAGSDGGGVNAIERAVPLLGALGELSDEWRGREDKRHPLLGTPQAQPTIVRGGAFIANVPEAVTIHLNATYLPGDADDGRLRQRAARRDRRAPSSGTPRRRLAAPRTRCAGRGRPTTRRRRSTPASRSSRPAPRWPRAIGRTAAGGHRHHVRRRAADAPGGRAEPGASARATSAGAHAPDEWIGIDELTAGRAGVRARARRAGAAWHERDERKSSMSTTAQQRRRGARRPDHVRRPVPAPSHPASSASSAAGRLRLQHDRLRARARARRSSRC